jgi:hypothetical protein
MPVSDPEATVRVLLEAAQLTISDEEFARYVNDYPIVRAAADALYLPELESVSPALDFDPAGQA